jgi:hypothetical protein
MQAVARTPGPVDFRVEIFHPRLSIDRRKGLVLVVDKFAGQACIGQSTKHAWRLACCCDGELASAT